MKYVYLPFYRSRLIWVFVALHWLAMYGVNAYHYPDTDWRKMLFVAPLYLTVVAVALWMWYQVTKPGGLWRGLAGYGVFFLLSYGLGLWITYTVAPAWDVRLHREEVPFSHQAYAIALGQFHYQYIKYALVIFTIERLLTSRYTRRYLADWVSQLTHQMEHLLGENRILARDVGAKRASLHFLANLFHRFYGGITGRAGPQAQDVAAWDPVIGYSLESQGEAGHALVPLGEEIKMLRKMMETEGTTATIDLNISGKTAGFKIPRLTLITCYENMLKHGDLTDPHCRPAINLIAQRRQLDFTTTNKVAATTAWHNPNGGTGLEKIRENLQLTYPDKFSLAYKAEAGRFSLRLSLCR